MNCGLKGDNYTKFISNQAEFEPDCLITDLANQFFSNGTSARFNCPESVPIDYVP